MRFVSKAEFAAMLRLTEQAIDMRLHRGAVERGDLPAPIKVGRKQLWTDVGIEAWAAAKIQAAAVAIVQPPRAKIRIRRRTPSARAPPPRTP